MGFQVLEVARMKEHGIAWLDEACQEAHEQRAQAAQDDDKKIPCEVYSRIVGYLRPVQSWNKGKRQEFEDRQTYRV